MAPNDANGFRYTPTSYLQRTRTENRPWTGGEEDDFQLEQEDRPSRKETSIDLHFQSRVNRRKEAYRSILKGHEEPECLGEMDDLELKASLDSNEKGHAVALSNSMAAREARQRRMSQKGCKSSSSPAPPTMSKEEAEAARVRNLRAHRLRTSLKATVEEIDTQEIMFRRRLLQQERDRLQKEKQIKRQEEERLEMFKIQEERRMLEEERKLLEQARQQAALEFQRHRQTQRHSIPRIPSPQESTETEETEDLPKRNRRRKGTRDADSSAMPEFSFLEEIQLMMRDSGMLRNCVHSCFGDEENLDFNDLVEEDVPEHWTKSVVVPNVRSAPTVRKLT